MMSRILASVASLCFALIPAFAPAAERSDAPGARASTPPGRLPPGITAERDIPYVDGGSAAQKLDVYFPQTADQPLPLIVWVHGGAWMSGDKNSCPALRFTAQGYVVASIDYRLSNEAIFPAQISDCQAAIRWLRANAAKYHIDAGHVGVWGASAGGHLVALIGTAGGQHAFPVVGANAGESDAVQAVCDWFGPTDLSKIAEQASPDSRLRHDAPDSPGPRLIGGPLQDNAEKVQAANPIHYITDKCPPFLIMHGTRDMVVPIGQSEMLEAALTKAGAPVMFQKLEGAGHGNGFDRRGVPELLLAFFDRNLKGADVKLQPLPDLREAGGDESRGIGRVGGPSAPRNPLDRLRTLTDDQREKLAAIRQKYADLLRKERQEEMEVLTEAQRQELRDLQQRPAADRGDAGRQARPESREDAGRQSRPESREDVARPPAER